MVGRIEQFKQLPGIRQVRTAAQKPAVKTAAKITGRLALSATVGVILAAPPLITHFSEFMDVVNKHGDIQEFIQQVNDSFTSDHAFLLSNQFAGLIGLAVGFGRFTKRAALVTLVSLSAGPAGIFPAFVMASLGSRIRHTLDFSALVPDDVFNNIL